MTEKPDWKKSPDELREKPFRPRRWSNNGQPIHRTMLEYAIKKADEEDEKKSMPDELADARLDLTEEADVEMTLEDNPPLDRIPPDDYSREEALKRPYIVDVPTGTDDWDH
jgi:hypothetical protein